MLAFMNESILGFSFAPLKWELLAMTLCFLFLTLCTLGLSLRKLRIKKLRIKKSAKVGVTSNRVIQIKRTQS